jgi:hypothetical protein
MNDEIVGKQICVLKTGKLLDHELAANTLTKHGIPFFRQLETVTGLILAMPFQPSMGPGTYFNIIVQEGFADKAKKILCELPIENAENPDLFHFVTSQKVKSVWKIFAWIMLVIIIICILTIIIRNFF